MYGLERNPSMRDYINAVFKLTGDSAVAMNGIATYPVQYLTGQ